MLREIDFLLKNCECFLACLTCGVKVTIQLLCDIEGEEICNKSLIPISLIRSQNASLA